MGRLAGLVESPGRSFQRGGATASRAVIVQLSGCVQMRLTAAASVGRRVADGFSLLEAVIAAGLLLLRSQLSRSCVVACHAPECPSGREHGRDRAACVGGERLGVLPFCAGSYPQAGPVPAVPLGDLSGRSFRMRRSRGTPGSARYFATAWRRRERRPALCHDVQRGRRAGHLRRALSSRAGRARHSGRTVLGDWYARLRSAPPASGTCPSAQSSTAEAQRLRFIRSAMARRRRSPGPWRPPVPDEAVTPEGRGNSTARAAAASRLWSCWSARASPPRS